MKKKRDLLFLYNDIKTLFESSYLWHNINGFIFLSIKPHWKKIKKKSFFA